MKARGFRRCRPEELPEDVVEIVFGQFPPLQVRFERCRPKELREDVVEIVSGQFPPLRVAQVRSQSCRQGLGELSAREDVVRSGRGRIQELLAPDDLLVQEDILAPFPLGAGQKVSGPASEELPEDVVEIVFGQFPALRLAQVGAGGWQTGLGDLPYDVLEIIFAQLPTICLARARAVCQGLNQFVRSRAVARAETPKPWLLFYRTVPRQQSYSAAVRNQQSFRNRTTFRAFDPESFRWYNLWLPTAGRSKVELGKGAGGYSGLVLLREQPWEESSWHYWVGNPLRGGSWQKVVFPKPDETDAQYAHELIVDELTKRFKNFRVRFRFEDSMYYTHMYNCTVLIYDSGERRWRKGATRYVYWLDCPHVAGCTTSKGVVYFRLTRNDGLRWYDMVGYVVEKDRFDVDYCSFISSGLGRGRLPWLFVDDTVDDGVDCREMAPAVLEFRDAYDWGIPQRRFYLARYRDKVWTVVHKSTLPPKPVMVDSDPEFLQIAGSAKMFYVARFCVPHKLCIFMYNSDVRKWEQVPERTYSEEEPYEPSEFSISTFLPRFDV